MHRLLVACTSTLLAGIALFISASPVAAANRYWVGTTNGANTNSTANWSTTQGSCGVGGGASVPSTGDVAIFTSSCTNSATINANWSVQGVNINSGYSGTITQGASITLTTGTAGFIQAGGTFTGSSANITSTSSFSLSGGTFNSTSGTLGLVTNFTISGGTFNHNNGTITLSGSTGNSVWSCNNSSFNTVSLSKTGYSITIGSDCTIPILGNNPTISIGTGSDSFTNNGTINITGNLTFNGTTFIQAAGTLSQTGTTMTFSRNLTLTGGSFDQDITVLNLGGSLTNTANLIPNNMTLNSTGTTGATFDCGTATFTAVTINRTGNGLTINNNCTLPISGTNPTLTVGTNSGDTLLNNGTITVTGNMTFTGGVYSQGTGTLTMTGTTATFSRNLILSGGTFTAASLTTLTVGGNLDNSGNKLPNGLTLTLNTNNAGVITCGTATFNSVTISKNAGTSLSMGSDCTFPIAGTNPTSTATITNAGTITVTGNWTVTGNYTSSSGSVLSVSGSSMTVSSSLTLNGGTFPSVTNLTVGANLTNTANILPNNISLTINSGTTSTISCGNASFSNVVITKAATNDVVNVGSTCVFPLGSNPSSTGVITNAGTINVTGNWNVAGTYTSSSASSVLTHSGDTITISEGLILTAGTFPSNITSIILGGILTNTANLISGSPTLLLNGSVQGIINCGNANFSSVSIAKSSYNRNITIDSTCSLPISGSNPTSVGTITNNGTITVTGNWTLEGGYTQNSGATFSQTGTTFNVTSSGSFTLNGGTFDTDITSLNVAGGFSNANNLLHSGIDLVFTPGGDGTILCGNAVYNSLTIARSSTTQDITISSDCAMGNFTFTGGDILNPASPYTYTVTGNVTTSSNGLTFGGENFTIKLAGSGDQTINQTSGVFTPLLVIDKPGGFAALSSNLTTSNTCTVTNGRFKLAGFNFVCGSTFSVSGTGTLEMIGSENPTTPNLSSGSTVIYTGDGDGVADTYLLQPYSYSNLHINFTDALDRVSSQNVLGTNEVGYWLMDEGSGSTVDDSSLNSNIASLNGNATFSSTVPSVNFANTSSIYLDGVDDYLNPGNNLSIFQNKSAVTMSAWIRRDTVNSSDQIFGVSTGTSNANSRASIYGNYTEIRCVGRSSDNEGQQDVSTSGLNAAINTWYHVACVIDYTNKTISIYVNGQLKTMQAAAFTANTTSDTASQTSAIGIDEDKGGDDFGGYIDDLRVYDRALTAVEIQSMANGNRSSQISSITVANNITLSAGTFVAPTTLNIGGDWINSGGIFTHDNGTVNLTGGNQSISGNNIFNNFTKSVNIARTLTFLANSLQTFIGNMTFSGTSGNLLSLRSTIDGTQWRIDPQGSRTVDYLDVKDSNNVNTTSIASSGHNITDSGNNTKWGFDSSAPAITLNTYTPDPGTDTTPLITGSAEDEIGIVTDVEFQMDSTAGAWTDCAADDGLFDEAIEAFSCQVVTPLSDGLHTTNVRATDGTAHTTPDGSVAAETFTIDTTDPTPPGTPAATSPTQDTTPTWSWSASTDVGGLATPAYTIEWSTAADFSGSTSDTSNTNSFTHSTPLTEGTWYFRASATDLAGNISNNSISGTVIIDTSNPTAPGSPSTTSPTAGTSQNWVWSAASDAVSGIAHYAWRVVTNLGAAVTNGTTASTSVITNLSNGIYTFFVKTIDNAGNESAETSGTVTVDRSAPTLTLTAYTPDPTDTSSITWSGTATDTLTNLTSIQYQIDGGTWDSCTAIDGSVDELSEPFECAVTGLADGARTITVRATDTVNNTTSGGSLRNDTVTVDTTAPTAPGTPSTTTPTSDTTPTWTWTESTDAGSGLTDPAYTVQWSTTSDFSGTVTSATTNVTTFTHSSTLTDGTWYFRVRASDGAENTSSYSSNGSVSVDTTHPSTPGTPSTTTPTSNTSQNWIWSAASDAGSGIAHYTWRIVTNLGAAVSSGTTNATGYISNLAEGAYTFFVKTVDLVGNESTETSSTVLIDTTAPTTPGTPSSATVETNVTPTWTWAESSDEGAGLSSSGTYIFEWSLSNTFSVGVSSATIDNSACSSGACNFTHASNLANGEWFARVRSTDVVGNVSSNSSTGSHIVNQTASDISAPTGSIEIGDGNSYTRSNVVNVSIQAEDDQDPSSLIEMQLSQLSDFSDTDWVRYENEQEITFSESNGTKTIYVKFRDSFNNISGTYSDSISLDTDSPDDFSLKEPSNNSSTNNGSVTFKFEQSDDDGSGLGNYVFTLNEEAINIDHSDPGGTHIREDDEKRIVYDDQNIALTFKKELADGKYTWEVTAQDKAGNTRKEGPRTFRVLTQGPTIQLNRAGSQNKIIKSTSTSDQTYFTTNRRPNFSGIADSGTTITVVLEDATVICSTTANSESTWNCTPESDLSYGTNTIIISATDSAGNVTQLPAINLVISGGTIGTELNETTTIPQPVAQPDDFGEATGTVTKNEDGTYEVKVKILDLKGNPVSATKVTLFSKPIETVTGEDGTAKFSNVPAGEHTLVVMKGNKTGEQKIYLDGDVREFQFTIVLTDSNPFLNPWVAMTVGMLFSISIITTALFVIEKRKAAFNF